MEFLNFEVFLIFEVHQVFRFSINKGLSRINSFYRLTNRDR